MMLFESLFFLIYRFIWTPLFLTLLFLSAPFDKKIKSGLEQRFRLNLKRRLQALGPYKSCILIHASSGEFEYAKPLIRELKKRDPQTPIIVTYFSPSYAERIQKEPGVDLAIPLPLDLPGPIHSFLRTVRPRLILVARTDLWPEFLNQSHKLKIPTLLFSATFRELQGLRGFLKLYYKWLFAKLSLIACVDTADEKHLKQSGTTTPVEILGDTRFDQVFYRLQNPNPYKSQLFSADKPVLIAGSTWPEDEKVLLPALTPLIKNNSLCCILAPHEMKPQHLSQVKNELTKLGLNFDLYSQTDQRNHPVLLIDQVGFLADIYPHAHLAFVGGSFRSKVHSVMEPLAAGLPVIVGPYHKNNREAVQFQSLEIPHLGAIVQSVKNAQELSQQLHHVLSCAQQDPDLKNKIRNEVKKKAGATERLLSTLQEKEWL